MKNNVIIANNFMKRFKGLMFDRKMEAIMFFPKCNGVHTFFMNYNLDILILNGDNIIIELHLNIPKNKIIKVKHKKKMTNIMEIPSNINHNYKLFDQVIL